MVYGYSYSYAIQSHPFAFYAGNSTPITISALSGTFYPISMYVAGKPSLVRHTPFLLLDARLNPDLDARPVGMQKFNGKAVHIPAVRASGRHAWL